MRLPHPCLLCGYPFLPKAGFCAFCAEELYLRREPRTRSERGLTIRSLFSWRGDLRAHVRLARALKGREEAEPWLDLALWMTEAFSAQSAALVPIPSRGRNHALGLARAIGHWRGVRVEEALILPESRSQKRLNREERKSVRFEASKKFSSVVIVDDIVTTGATARAAWWALGRPQTCEVWCLLDRRPCGSPWALL